MTEIKQIYKCEICGNIIEVLHTGAGELVCCGQGMKLMAENTVEAATEKHVPVIEENDNGIRVSVGSVAHPMETDHYIEWIELTADGTSYRKFLKPGEEPVAEFQVGGKELSAREYCNLHGLWKG